MQCNLRLGSEVAQRPRATAKAPGAEGLRNRKPTLAEVGFRSVPLQGIATYKLHSPAVCEASAKVKQPGAWNRMNRTCNTVVSGSGCIARPAKHATFPFPSNTAACRGRLSSCGPSDCFVFAVTGVAVHISVSACCFPQAFEVSCATGNPRLAQCVKTRGRSYAPHSPVSFGLTLSRSLSPSFPCARLRPVAEVHLTRRFEMGSLSDCNATWKHQPVSTLYCK